MRSSSISGEKGDFPGAKHSSWHCRALLLFGKVWDWELIRSGPAGTCLLEDRVQVIHEAPPTSILQGHTVPAGDEMFAHKTSAPSADTLELEVQLFSLSVFVMQIVSLIWTPSTQHFWEGGEGAAGQKPGATAWPPVRGLCYCY